MNGPSQVQARIAMLHGRFAVAGGSARGGGRVGAGMQAALAAAADAAATSSTTPARLDGQTFATAGPTAPSAPPPDWAERLPAGGQRWAGDIEAAAARHGVAPELLGALVWTESAFDPAVVSPAGAIGLGQLMPGTAAELGVDPTDPQQNLDGAARYLRQQLDRFGDQRLALAAYNAGPGRVAAAGGVPSITETTEYVARVSSRTTLLGGPS